MSTTNETRFTTEHLRHIRSIVESGTPLARNTVLHLIERAHEAIQTEASVAKVRELATSLAPFGVDVPAKDLLTLLDGGA